MTDSRRSAVGNGAHRAPARERSGASGSPRATEPGFGAEPRVTARPGYLRCGLIIAQIYLICTLVGLAAVYHSTDFSQAHWLYAASLILVLACGGMLWGWKVHTGSLFDPYGLFLIAGMLFNGGRALLELLRLNEPSLVDGRLPAEIVLQAIFLVALGLAALHLGALIGAGAPARAPMRIAETEADDVIRRNTRVVGWILLAIAFLPTSQGSEQGSISIFNLSLLHELRSAVVTVMSEGYFGLYQREYAVGLDAAPQILATFIVPAALFLLAGSKGNGTSIWTAQVVMAIYVCINFFLGYRGYPTMALIAFAWLWHRAIRPLPAKTSVAAAAAVIFVGFPIIGAVRTIGGAQRISLDVLRATWENIRNPFEAIIGEFGDTIWTVAYALYFVPAVRAFDYGMSYVYALLRLFPNLFWRGAHPSVGHAPSEWLIALSDPYTARTGGGLGYSFIAEAYSNFGWIGGPLLLVILGAVLGRIVTVLHTRPDPARLALAASALAFGLLYARGDAAGIIRGLGWYALGPYAAVRLLGMLRADSVLQPVAAARLGRQP